MSHRRYPLSVVLTLSLLIFTAGCDQPLQMEGFDPDVWKSDKYGCEGSRFQFLEVIQAHNDYLLRRDQNELEALLGPPDEHELDNRRRKYFYYNLQPGTNCENKLATPVRLQIKFNALGLSTEVFLENY